MAGRRIVVAGGGVVGASIAYHLGARAARTTSSSPRRRRSPRARAARRSAACGSSSRRRPRCASPARASSFFRSLGPELFQPVGYLFLATSEDGLAELERRREVQASLGVPVERVDPSLGRRASPSTTCSGPCSAPRTARPTRRRSRASSCARAAASGVEVLEHTDALELEWDTLVLATGAASAPLAAKLGVELPVRPLVRQLVETASVPGLPRDLPLTIEAESGFHFRRRGDALVLAMPEATPRWGRDETVDETSSTTGSSASHGDTRPRRRRGRAGVGGAVRHDARRPPDRRGRSRTASTPRAGSRATASCSHPRSVGSSPTSCSANDPGFDLAPYRLERFEAAPSPRDGDPVAALRDVEGVRRGAGGKIRSCGFLLANKSDRVELLVKVGLAADQRAQGVELRPAAGSSSSATTSAPTRSAASLTSSMLGSSSGSTSSSRSRSCSNDAVALVEPPEDDPDDHSDGELPRRVDAAGHAADHEEGHAVRARPPGVASTRVRRGRSGPASSPPSRRRSRSCRCRRA